MDPDPAIFVTEGTGTFASFFKAKKSTSTKSHKTVGIKVFLTIFPRWIEGSGSGFIPLTNGSGSGSRRPKTYGSDGSGSTTLLVGMDQIPVTIKTPNPKRLSFLKN